MANKITGQKVKQQREVVNEYWANDLIDDNLYIAKLIMELKTVGLFNTDLTDKIICVSNDEDFYAVDHRIKEYRLTCVVERKIEETSQLDCVQISIKKYKYVKGYLVESHKNYKFDDNGNIISEHAEGTIPTLYKYDRKGNLIYRNRMNSEEWWRYNQRGQETYYTNSVGRIRHTKYNKDGHIIRVNDENGEGKIYRYNKHNQLIYCKNIHNDEFYKWIYNIKGELSDVITNVDIEADFSCVIKEDI